jgi:epsilon-lactone hydrolase
LLDYRLAPEHPCPAALEDAVAGYRWLLERGVRPEQIVIGGDSSGGGLALATLVRLREQGVALPAAGVLLSPWVDLTIAGPSIQTRAAIDPLVSPESLRLAAGYYLGGADPRMTLASPLYADLRGLPPLLIQAGDHEVLLSDATRLAEQARAAGVDVTLDVWDEMWHVWQAWAEILPEGQQAIERIGAFIRRQLPRNRTTASSVE